MRLDRVVLVVTLALVAGSFDIRSAPAAVRFADSPLGNLPPTVQITCPTPSDINRTYTLPSIRILWNGTDPDGIFTRKPVKYKYILLSRYGEFSPAVALWDPDSLRRYYAHHPLGAWAGWDSTGADTMRVKFTNLIPLDDYVFAVIAFDEAGAYSPVFDFKTNLLLFRPSFAGFTGPRLTLQGAGFQYQYPSGGYCVCPSAEVPVDVAERRSATFQWFADADGPCGSADIRAYRWALDIADVSDNTPRTDGLTDVQHWSTKSLATTSATVGPFIVGSQHRLYVEAEDNAGQKSLGILRLTAIPSPNGVPECAAAVAEPRELWPANGKFVPVTLSGVTDPDGDALTVRVTGVTQDEPLLGQGCADATIDSSGGLELRASASGGGNGRVYTIWFYATDGLDICHGSVQVAVPHDRGHGASVDDGQRFNSLGPCAGDRHLQVQNETPDVVALSPMVRTGNVATLRYSLPAPDHVVLAVFDVTGRRVATLENASQGAGAHEVAWNTSSVPHGMYFCRLQAGSVTVTRTLLIAR